MAAINMLLFLYVTSCLSILASSQSADVRFVVWEERPERTYVGSVALESGLFSAAATNASNENLSFNILRGSSKYANYFTIDPTTSVVRTSQVLDREYFEECSATCILNFLVAVYRDNDSDLIEVLVSLEDLNDNTPTFQQSRLDIEVLESESIGYPVLIDFAEDLDTGGNNSVQNYQLVPESDLFELEVQASENQPLEFTLKLKNRLDHETVNLYQFVILAKDGGQPQETGTISIYITVLDANDNEPVFAKSQYNITTDENIAIGTHILLLSATDLDDGQNAEILYKFGNRVSNKVLEYFSINKTTGAITVIGRLNYETDQEFDFVVEAYDNGEPSLSSQTKVVVKVEDVNDNYPQININVPPGGSFVSEEAEIGAYIGHMLVQDLDQGDNGVVVCQVSDPHFRLDTVEPENNFKLVLNMTLDHDTTPTHRVNISCHDNGSPVRVNWTIFDVHVEDVNDNLPVFDQEVYKASIMENNPRITSLLSVRATDKDSGKNGQVVYSLHPEVKDMFTMDSFTGVISTNVSLDRETFNEIIFRVLAEDEGNPPLTSTGTVHVTILDENDNSPIFQDTPIVFDVRENQPPQVFVGNVSAIDPDNYINGTFDFIFTTDINILNLFDFDTKGGIRTRHSLDREDSAFHKFFISAVDYGGRSSSTLVTVRVTDVNDNIPAIFFPSNYDNKKVIPYTLAVGDVLAEIDARDEDFGENAKLSYFIDQDNSTFLFKMDETTGQVFVNNSMSEKVIGLTFSLVVRVQDRGTPPLQSWANLYIKVELGGENVTNAPTGQISSNVWIVIGVVIATVIIAMVILFCICKICWYDRRRDSDKQSDIIIQSDPVNPKLINSSSSSSSSGRTGSFDDKNTMKLSNINIKPADNSVFDATFSSDEKQAIERMYFENVGELGFSYGKKTDEDNSDNSGELGTRDSGQGGSDIDLNSLNDHHDNDIELSGGQMTSDGSHYERNLSPDNINHGNSVLRKDSLSGDVLNCSHNSDSSDSMFRKQVANFTITPYKTAARKEIVKIRKTPKRVMFSDDLENSQSSTTSSGVSFAYSDINKMIAQLGPRPREHRLSSDDTSSSMDCQNLPRNDNLRRSVDNLPLLSRLYHGNSKPVQTHRQFSLPSDQLPSNQRLQVPISHKSQNYRNGGRSMKDTGPLSSSSEGDRNSVDVYSLSTTNSKCSESRDDGGSSTTSGSYSLTLDESWAGVPAAVYDKDVFV